MGKLEEAFKEATRNLDLTKRFDRLRAGYVWRRAGSLLKQKPSSDPLDIAVQVTREQVDIVAAVGQYAKALITGTDSKKPAHLDLAVMSNVGGSSTNKKALEKTYFTNRYDWLSQIVWRAVTIHGDLLWKKSGSGLETEALDEIVDRRLHAAEQLYCNVNSGGIDISPLRRTWTVAGPGGPWTDGVLVRNFEYPFLPKAPFKDILPKLKSWKDAGDAILFTSSSSDTDSRANIRFPKRVTKAWLVKLNTETFTKWVVFQPNEGLKHADVFNAMFDPPRENYFDRNWLYCDQVGSSVNIKALELGMGRRPGGPHANFEKVMTTEDYVRLGPVVRVHNEQTEGFLMTDDKDEFFENTFIDINDLQVGDFVCFWNNRLYDLIASGAWRNEYSHVMDVDTDEKGNVKVATDGPQIWLAGHGLHNSLYNAMGMDLVKNIKGILDELRKALVTAVTDNTTIPTTRNGQALVQWSPYEAFDSPGAWWIKIPKDVWRKEWVYTSLAEVVKSVPRTVAKEAGGTGYNAPPDADAVYFPLFEPKVSATDGDSWRAYLNKRKADATFRAPTKLNDLTVDGRLALGLYYHGNKPTIPVVRPKVRI